MDDESVAPHWYPTVLEAQRSAAVVAEALGHRLHAWSPQPSLLRLRSLTTCVQCAKSIEVHPYWEDGRFIGFFLSGAALNAVCPNPVRE
jgi:hypothetical protein